MTFFGMPKFDRSKFFVRHSTMENNPKRNIYYTFCHIIFFLIFKKYCYCV
jgi:hypothetical protein